MRVEHTTEQAVTGRVELDASAHSQLVNRLRQYTNFKSCHQELERRLRQLVDEIGTLRDATGSMSVSIDGYTITLVAGTRKVLNKRKLVALGCAASWIEQAMEEKPNRPYTKITEPREDREADNVEVHSDEEGSLPDEV